MNIKSSLPIIIAIVVFILFSSAYTIDQRERGIKFKFREIVETDIQPGLHFKIPFVNTVKTFSTQILTLDAKPERFLTNEKKYVVVDFFVKWKIDDVNTYYKSTGGGRITEATRLLEQIMKDGLRNEFSRRTIKQALSDERGAIMEGLQAKSNEVAKQLGIKVIDARVSQIDFPESISESVFDRMRSERKQVAQDFRSRGKEDAEKIRAEADKDSTVIKAKAYRDSEIVRGEGDALAADTYAKAYQQDPEFYAFYRSLNAYKKALSKEGDLMVLEPDSEFFNYFKSQHDLK
jgi:membrane protease subunit HflC